MKYQKIQIENNLEESYKDVLTTEVISALSSLADLNKKVKQAMSDRLKRRADRHENGKKITFLDPAANIPGTNIKVQDARDGNFEGSEIPADLQRQWIQGTGPAAKPDAPLERSIRNIAYALLSGADGWMFDGEDALGQIDTMALDNQRNLKLALHRDPVFMRVAEDVAGEMNRWAQSF